MAKPRIFVSSTYYDLKNLRNDLQRFITAQGYESILNEDGKITYSREEKLEDACYREVQGLSHFRGQLIKHIIL